MYRIIIVYFASILILSGQTLIGPIEVCSEDCHTYSITSTGDVFLWQITNGTTNNNRGEEVTICWEEEGSGRITINKIENGVSTKLVDQVILIEPHPVAEILFPIYPICQVKDSIRDEPNDFETIENCIFVCPGSKVRYSPKAPNGLDFTWEVEGALSSEIADSDLIAEWGDDGMGMLSLFAKNDIDCVDSIQYCIEIMDKPEVTINLLNNSIDLDNLCQEQIVQLVAESPDALEYLWLSAGGYSHTGENVELSFSESGTHVIQLVTTTACFCRDTSTLEFTVLDALAPIINCTGTTCINESATYTTDVVCGKFNWNVSSEGTIIEGGGPLDNYITVEWTDGPYGSVSLLVEDCDDNICTKEVSITIPVITPTTEIYGPTIVCKEGTSTYSAPLFAGAEYTWSVSGNGFISNGWGTNSIEVTWSSAASAADNATIQVDINHCFLECSSTAQLAVTLLPEFNISGDPVICAGSEGYFIALESWNDVVVDWYVTTPDGTTIEAAKDVSGLNGFKFENGTGLYQMVAKENSGAYCNTEEIVFVEVVDAPEPITGVNGLLEICPGETYEYSIIDPTLDHVWVIRNGATTTTYYGDNNIITWNASGPYSIQVYRSNPETGCRTGNLQLEINPLQTVPLIGSATSCIDQVTEYSLQDIDAKDADWSIEPSDAGTYKISDLGQLLVHWHVAGTHKLKSSYCSANEEIEVTVLDAIEPTVNYPEGVCPSELGLVNVDKLAGESFILYNEDGNVEGVDNPLSLGSGYYRLEFTDINGCVSYSGFYIDSYVDPEVTLSSLGWALLCFPNGEAYLEALTTNEGLDYKWTFEGVDQGVNDPKLLADSEGAYSVKVSNKDGCFASASAQLICVEGGGQCNCRSDGGTRFEATQGDFCNEYQFKNTSFDFIPGTLVYNFGDPGSGADNSSTLEDPIHRFSTAGHFIVRLSGQVNSSNIPDETCPARYTEFVTVEAVADFDYLPACSNEAIQFREIVSFLSDYSIVAYEWDFDDPASGLTNISTDKDPDHIFSNPGSYDVKLTATTNTGCKAEIVKTIEITSPPVVAIGLPSSLCENETIEFVAIGENLVEFEWDFDDPLSGARNMSSNISSLHIYDTPGTYTITLSATDIKGCTNVTSVPIEITTNNFAGDITSDKTMPICYGDSAILSGPAGGTAYLWSTGETTQDIVVENSGNYSVTVITANTCEFIPKSMAVNVIKPINPVIKAYTEVPGSFNQEVHLEKLEICEGERFSLGTDYNFNATYAWSTGQTSYFINQWDVPLLPPGDHIIELEMTDTEFGCTISAEPFHITVHARPTEPTISSDQSDLCADKPHTLSVNNPEAGLTYYWNNGEIGPEITVYEPGFYFATGTNEFGCSSQSIGISIYPLPSKDGFITGCHEVCFPYELCVTENNLSAIQWYMNGSPISSGTGSTLTVQEAGEYYVEMTNTWGCTVVTDVLSLSPKTQNLSLKGIAFVDENENGVLDSSEEILENIPITINSGNTIIQSTATSSTGEYLFDPLERSRATVTIDASGLNIDDSKCSLEFVFDITSCLEDLIINFPLVMDCDRDEDLIETYTCVGSPVDILGTDYDAGDKDTLRYTNMAGCDSLIIINVLAYPKFNFSLLAEGSCAATDNGGLTISTSNATGKLFSIDGINFDEKTSFDELSSGNYTLFAIDENGCNYQEDFTIDAYADLNYTASIANNCDQATPGIISVVANQNISLSLDMPDNFIITDRLENITPGAHTLYIEDENGCVYEENINIAPLVTPDIVLTPTGTCENENVGVLSVDTQGTADINFSLESSGPFSTKVNYGDLSAGDYMLFAQDLNGCVFEFPFTITAASIPVVNIDSQNSCADDSNGSITILGNNLSDVEVSINGSVFTNTLAYNDLSVDDYQLVLRGSNGCMIEQIVAIENVPDLELEFVEAIMECDTREMTLGLSGSNMENLNFTWSSGETTSELMAKESGNYSVEIDNGCESEIHSWELEFPEEANTDVYVPNIFEPNLTAENSRFRAFVNGDLEISKFNILVVDRWGNQVFSSDDPEVSWDGRNQDKNIEMGVYLWLYDVEFLGCKEIIRVKEHGSVTIAR